MFDAHCYLQHKLSGEPRLVEQSIEMARRAGVTGFLIAECGDKRERHSGLVEQSLVGQEQNVVVAAGLGPALVSTLSRRQFDEALGDLRRDLSEQDFGAIGEIGLDFELDDHGDGRKRQRRALIAQIALAQEFDLPVVLKVTRAHNTLIQILRSHRLAPAGGMICDYSGSVRQVGPLLMLNLDLSVGPAIVGDRARQLRAVVNQVPDDRLLVESAPPAEQAQQQKGNSNGFDCLSDVVEAVADIWGTSPTKVARCTEENGRRRFGVDAEIG